MRILLIEDDNNWKTGFKEELRKFFGELIILDASNKIDAFALLNANTTNQAVHLIILDLHLPSEPGSNDESVQHGLDIHKYIVEELPRIPLLVLSGEAQSAHVGELMKQPQLGKLFGGEKINLCGFADKASPLPAIEFIRGVFDNLAAVSKIKLNCGFELIRLNDEENIVLKSFVRGQTCISAQLALLTDGLSGTRVFLLTLYSASGALTLNAVAKLGPTTEIFAEAAKHSLLGSLRIGCVPHLIEPEPVAYGRVSGLFMRNADGHEKDLFDCIRNNQSNAVKIVELLQSDFSQLVAAAATVSGPPALQMLRNFFDATVSSDARSKIPTDIAIDLVFEVLKNATIVWGRQHGDLHAANVLVNDQGTRAILIDCADIGERPICFDMIYLELMLFFHPKSVKLFPKIVQGTSTSNWPEMIPHYKDVQVAEFVDACRNWQNKAVGATSQEVMYFIALCISLRQLKYSDISTQVALNIARACYKKILGP